jgi:hypothetical protein
MVSPPRNAALRRMKLEDLITKMEQIEQQAALTLDEYPDGLTVERQRLVLAIARQVRAHLVDQLRGGPRAPAPAADDDASHLGSVDIPRTAANG